MIIINQNQIRLCRQGSCCPVIERITDNEFAITDDYNGKVQLTREELFELTDAVKHLTES